MRNKIIAIKDLKAEAITTVTTAPNIAIAIRDFKAVCLNQNSPMNRWPEDFNLLVLAEIDLQTGKIYPMEQIITAAKASDFVEKKDDKDKE